MKPPEVIVLIFLIYASLIDIRTREIEPVSTAMTAMAGIVYCGFARRGNLTGLLLSLVPGLLLIAFAVISRGRFGTGDGIVIAVTGLFLEASDMLISLAAAFLLSACFSAGVIVISMRRGLQRAGSKSFPFLPFLLAGFTVSLLCNYWP